MKQFDFDNFQYTLYLDSLVHNKCILKSRYNVAHTDVVGFIPLLVCSMKPSQTSAWLPSLKIPSESTMKRTFLFKHTHTRTAYAFTLYTAWEMYKMTFESF